MVTPPHRLDRDIDEQTNILKCSHIGALNGYAPQSQMFNAKENMKIALPSTLVLRPAKLKHAHKYSLSVIQNAFASPALMPNMEIDNMRLKRFSQCGATY